MNVVRRRQPGIFAAPGWQPDRGGEVASAASAIGYSLPDAGRRVRMELREVERRLREDGDRWADVIPPQPSSVPAWTADAYPRIMVNEALSVLPT